MPITINGDGNISGFNKIDAPTFVVDETNNRVGIGTSSPSTLLHATNNSPDGDIRIRLGTTNSIELIRNSSSDNWLRSYGGPLILDQQSNSNIVLRTGATERMRIDSSGRVTMPYQPAFFAIKTTTTSADETVSGHQNVQINNGNHFNASNGRFTAPVSGIYLIFASQLTNIVPGSQYIQKNGVTIPGWWIRPSAAGGDYDDGTRVVIANLNSGDYISVYADFTAYSDGNGWTTFGGYLLG